MFYKPTTFDENRQSYYYKIEILNFFLSELLIILRVGRKGKNCLEIFASIGFERDWSVGLGHGCANHATEVKCFCPPSTAVT